MILKKKYIVGASVGAVAGLAGYIIGKSIGSNAKKTTQIIDDADIREEHQRKKILVLANVASMIVQFNMRNLRILQELGFDVEVACNFKEGNTCTEEVLDSLRLELSDMGIPYHQIDFARGLSNIKEQIFSFSQVKRLIKERGYDVIFVQSTIAGIAARVYGRRYGCKVIYIAHGFQFYDGAAKSRWILFHTIEKILSRKTDSLILTNEDDFKLAKRDFKTLDTRFVPGVGVDIKTFELDEGFDRDAERRKRGIEPDDYVIFSAGELTERKNHRIIMDIIRGMDNPKIKYLICGIGPLEDEYKTLIRSWGMERQIILLGYQTDLKSIYGISDLFILPSLNEGLPVCLLMSIASKVPSICSDIRGNHELVRDKRYLFPPMDREAIKNVIDYAMSHNNEEIVEQNYINLQKYGSENVDKLMREVFSKYR